MNADPTTERGTVTITFDPDAIRQRHEAARQMVSDLCHQRRQWMMSIPARRDYDPDLVISDSLQDVWKLLLAYESQKEQIVAAESALATAQTELDEFKRNFAEGIMEGWVMVDLNHRKAVKEIIALAAHAPEREGDTP